MSVGIALGEMVVGLDRDLRMGNVDDEYMDGHLQDRDRTVGNSRYDRMIRSRIVGACNDHGRLIRIDQCRRQSWV